MRLKKTRGESEKDLRKNANLLEGLLENISNKLEKGL